MTKRHSDDERKEDPTVKAPSRRRVGFLKGKIHMTGDFDGLPSDVLDAMEGNEPKKAE